MSERLEHIKAAASAGRGISPADPDDKRPVSVSARLGRLQFHESGKFRVLQFTDIQDGPKVSPDTIRLIEAACDAARPDVVVFTGDQIAGYDSAYSKTGRKRRWLPQPTGLEESDLEHTRELVRSTISQFVQPLVDRNIPFAVTYGNHDFQCGLETSELDAIYREFPGCLNPEPPATAIEANDAQGSSSADEPFEGDARSGRIIGYSKPRRANAVSGLSDQQVYACEPGTFALPVSDVEHDRTVIGLVLVDSGDYAQAGGYGSPSELALEFLGVVPELIETKSLVFQHIAIPQFYDVLKTVPVTTAYAIQGYRTFDSACYVLDESKTEPGSYLGEGVSCPDVDCGEFDVMKESGGYFGLFVGHDHRNGFVGTSEGIMLGVTPTCGFGSYGPVPAKRAARLFEFDIRHPDRPRTQLLEFGDLVGAPKSRKAYTFAMSHVPTSPGDAWNLLRKPGTLATIAAGFAAAVASLGFIGKKR